MSRPLVELWTDGSGTSGEPGGWACILRRRQGDEWVEREISGAADVTTSQRMEITAVLEGLSALKCPCRVMVYTDSQYVANTISKGWIFKWKRNNWHGKANGDLWEQILPLLWKHKVHTNWVRGHNGTELNERCDVLAGHERERLIDQLASIF